MNTWGKSMRFVDVTYALAATALAALALVVATRRGRRAVKSVTQAIARVVRGFLRLSEAPQKGEAPAAAAPDPDVTTLVIRTRPQTRQRKVVARAVWCMACKCAWTIPADMPEPAPCPNCEYYAGVSAFLEVQPLTPDERLARAAHWREVGPPEEPTSWYNPN